MLNETNVRKWIEALRSGKYTQTRERLKDDVGYCCWGVACEISGLGEFKWMSRDHEWAFSSGDGCRSLGNPSLGVIAWAGAYDLDHIRVAGIKHDRDGRNPLECAYSLIECNDEIGLSFDQIADILEAHLNGWDLNPTNVPHWSDVAVDKEV
jgi:hypothetical protein